jgi:hypothetical protein
MAENGVSGSLLQSKALSDRCTEATTRTQALPQGPPLGHGTHTQLKISASITFQVFGGDFAVIVIRNDFMAQLYCCSVYGE